jgi:hypothetical protein
MDGSFLAFRHFLQRILAGHKDHRDDPKAAERRPERREPQADIPDDWARIEL